jgi:hypothetical protein
MSRAAILLKEIEESSGMKYIGRQQKELLDDLLKGPIVIQVTDRKLFGKHKDLADLGILRMEKMPMPPGKTEAYSFWYDPHNHAPFELLPGATR